MIFMSVLIPGCPVAAMTPPKTEPIAPPAARALLPAVSIAEAAPAIDLAAVCIPVAVAKPPMEIPAPLVAGDMMATSILGSLSTKRKPMKLTTIKVTNGITPS